MEENYQLALLYFVHLLIGADGIADRSELDALLQIKKKEKILDHTFDNFNTFASSKSEREIYQSGLDHLSKCSDQTKLKIFATLYRLSEVDGRVHGKEIKLLLYSVKTAGIEFNDVVDFAKSNPSIF
jgi:hypothetical protein